MRLHEYLVRSSREHTEHAAVVFGERRIGYPKYRGQVERAARAFLCLGLRPGERVALLLPNGPSRTENGL